MKAMTLRLPDAMHEALRQRAFNERKSITALVLLAISEMPLVKPARLCDARDCWNEPTRRPTTPGGFHFCDEHRHKGEQEFAREALPAEPEYVGNDRDRLKVRSDILWQGLNDAKTHIERAEQERDAYAAVIAGVLAVHEPGERDDGLGGYLCEGCDSRWENCPTRRIIFAPREGSPDYWERFDRNKPGHMTKEK